ncbi:lysophospholipid acyltransferase family protein [bacterium]|nr:lysophospholipid acyltransferase family protein [bacterium]
MNRLGFLGYYLFGWLARLLATVLFSTCRISVIGREIEEEYLRNNPGKGLLYASWHRGLFLFTYFYRFLGFIVMASASKDGELATQAVKRFGWIPVRGSSSRFGKEALHEMQHLVLEGHRAGLVVDAPRGPAHVSKIGIIILAKRTGLPIIPVMWAADRSWRLDNWDRTIIPKPFARIVYLYHDRFLTVPEEATDEECEQKRLELDAILNTMMEKVDNYFLTAPTI